MDAMFRQNRVLTTRPSTSMTLQVEIGIRRLAAAVAVAEEHTGLNHPQEVITV